MKIALCSIACSLVGLTVAHQALRGGATAPNAKQKIADLSLAQKEALAKTAGLSPTTIHFVPVPKLVALDAAHPYRAPLQPFEVSLNCVGVDMPPPAVNLMLLRSNTDDCAWVWVTGAKPGKFYLVTFKVAPYGGAAAKVQTMPGTSSIDGYIADHGPVVTSTVNSPMSIGVLITPGSNTASLNVQKGANFGYLSVQEATIEEL